MTEAYHDAKRTKWTSEWYSCFKSGQILFRTAEVQVTHSQVWLTKMQKKSIKSWIDLSDSTWSVMFVASEAYHGAHANVL